MLPLTKRERHRWMLQTTWRDNRVLDGVVVQNLSASPSFFASTTILIIGGLLAVLGTSDKATELVKELPFAATAWFFSPWTFMAATLGVIWILYRREFQSEVLPALR